MLIKLLLLQDFFGGVRLWGGAAGTANRTKLYRTRYPVKLYTRRATAPRQTIQYRLGRPSGGGWRGGWRGRAEVGQLFPLCPPAGHSGRPATSLFHFQLVPLGAVSASPTPPLTASPYPVAAAGGGCPPGLLLNHHVVVRSRGADAGLPMRVLPVQYAHHHHHHQITSAGRTNRIGFKLGRLRWGRRGWAAFDYYQLGGGLAVGVVSANDDRWGGGTGAGGSMRTAPHRIYLNTLLNDCRPAATHIDCRLGGGVGGGTAAVVVGLGLGRPARCSHLLGGVVLAHALNNPSLLKLFVLQFGIYLRWQIVWANWQNLYKQLRGGHFWGATPDNLYPRTGLLYQIRRQFLKTHRARRFTTQLLPYFLLIGVRFLEYCVGGRIYFKLYPFILKQLAFFELVRCMIWARRVRVYRRLVGHQLFLNESLQLIYLALKLKDPHLLLNWMVVVLGKVDFWKHRLFLRYLRYVFKTFFWAIFADLAVRGVRVQLRGKINVAGNARTRAIDFRFGLSSISTVQNRVVYEFGRVRTFTGVLGLKVWFFY